MKMPVFRKKALGPLLGRARAVFLLMPGAGLEPVRLIGIRS